MKNILLFWMLSLVAFATACSPDGNVLPVYGGPGEIYEKPLRATLTGESVNVLPDKTVTLAASAEGADCYWWRKDGKLIEGAVEAAYIAVESGVYEVAGVNDFGRGDWSEPKTVTIEQEKLPFIDRLTGRWRVTERVTYLSDLMTNNHDIVIKKVDDETVRIFSFNDSSNSNDVVTATVNNEESTFTILYQEAVDCLYGDDQIRCFYASAEERMPAGNIGKGIGPLTITESSGQLSIVFPSTFEISGGKGSEDYYPATYYILAFDSNDNCLGMAALAAETVWKKL